MKNIIKNLLVLLLIAGISSGCEDFLSPSVDQNRPTETAVQTVDDIQSVIYGTYDDLNRVGVYGRDFYVASDVMSDNAWSNGASGRMTNHDVFDYTVNSGYASSLWNVSYQAISGANLALQSDIESTPAVDNYMGQAYAVRALSHFNLLLAFGQQYVAGGDPGNGVPYVTTYADEENFGPSRDAVSDVWANIESDLNDAVSLMDPSSNSLIELDYWATRALQTRYYLYTEQYDQVVTVAEDIINNGPADITAAGDLVDTWESGSGPSSLFELSFTGTDNLGTDNISRLFRPTSYGDVEVSEDLYTTHEDDDIRRNLYGVPGDTVGTLIGDQILEGYRMLSKYRDEEGSDNVRVIRYAEVVLNYAEALARGASGQESAVDALNRLADERYENGSPYTGSVTVDEVLTERRLELALEGQRLYDLLRTGNDIQIGDNSSARTEVISADDYRVALPIPQSEINANSNVAQNEGYN